MKKSFFTLLLMAAALGAVAQPPTCTGGLGDPIVDITFGAGSGFGPALGAGITNMTYIANTCPEDGYYTIVHSTSGCYGGSWINVPADHTGNPNGYFMLINASYQPSDFYVQTISGLCPGTNYQFAAWVVNLVSQQGEIEPNITFTIESTTGAVLGTYNTGNIPATGGVDWVQYGFYFNTPPGVNTVVLRMTNNASGGIGNDLGLDDITFRAAGPNIQSSVTGFSSDSITLCQSDSRTLGFSAIVENCYPTAVYQWQISKDSGISWADIPGATMLTWLRPASAPGSFLYRLTVAQSGNIGIVTCEVASAPIQVNVIATPSPAVTISPGADSSCVGSIVTITAVPDGGGPAPVYQWMVNGSSAGAGGPVFSSSTLTSSDVVRCQMTSDAACVLDPVVLSNAVSVVVTAIPATAVGLAASATTICQDSPVIFTATPVNGGTAPFFQWTVNGLPAGGDSSIFTDAALNNGDAVTCTMTAALTCAQPVQPVAPIEMIVYPVPSILLTPDTVIAGGASVRLSPVITGTIASYRWSPATGLSDALVPSPVASPAGSTLYRLTVVSSDGCAASAVEDVEVFYRLAMPAAFTPNRDGRNDLFRVPPSIAVKVLQLAVYNRLGGCVFSAAGSEGWDGSFGGHPQPAGQYVWVLEYVNPLTQSVETAKGVVILVR
ncbi:MAG TPA: gliding motility-associated C-terminal domain-containing protein [Puia sp.]|nr:gliding motility-associated C-terminal domain-containing protein [Puia sp.]